jgi:uncharacterized protein YpmS
MIFLQLGCLVGLTTTLTAPTKKMSQIAVPDTITVTPYKLTTTSKKSKLPLFLNSIVNEHTVTVVDSKLLADKMLHLEVTINIQRVKTIFVFLSYYLNGWQLAKKKGSDFIPLHMKVKPDDWYCNDDGDDYIRGDCKTQRSVIKISIPRAMQKMTQEKKEKSGKKGCPIMRLLLFDSDKLLACSNMFALAQKRPNVEETIVDRFKEYVQENPHTQMNEPICFTNNSLHIIRLSLNDRPIHNVDTQVNDDNEIFITETDLVEQYLRQLQGETEPNDRMNINENQMQIHGEMQSTIDTLRHQVSQLQSRIEEVCHENQQLKVLLNPPFQHQLSPQDLREDHIFAWSFAFDEQTDSLPNPNLYRNVGNGTILDDYGVACTDEPPKKNQKMNNGGANRTKNDGVRVSHSEQQITVKNELSEEELRKTFEGLDLE